MNSSSDLNKQAPKPSQQNCVFVAQSYKLHTDVEISLRMEKKTPTKKKSNRQPKNQQQESDLIFPFQARTQTSGFNFDG